MPDRGVAEEFVRDLESLYGQRLSRVILFGSVARGEAHEESDIDLVAVLERLDNRWEEKRRLSDLEWEFLVRTGHLVHTIPVTEEEFATSGKPVFVNARRQGVPLM